MYDKGRMKQKEMGHHTIIWNEKCQCIFAFWLYWHFQIGCLCSFKMHIVEGNCGRPIAYSHPLLISQARYSSVKIWSIYHKSVAI